MATISVNVASGENQTCSRKVPASPDRRRPRPAGGAPVQDPRQPCRPLSNIACGSRDRRRADRPGTSLVTLANRPDDPERVVFSEYHAMGAASGAFMIRKGRWKLVHYVGMPPELYDLAEDPAELTNLGENPSHEAVRADLMAELMRICDPQTVKPRAGGSAHHRSGAWRCRGCGGQGRVRRDPATR